VWYSVLPGLSSPKGDKAVCFLRQRYSINLLARLRDVIMGEFANVIIGKFDPIAI
jgi:hypothetical protein